MEFSLIISLSLFIALPQNWGPRATKSIIRFFNLINTGRCESAIIFIYPILPIYFAIGAFKFNADIPTGIDLYLED